MSFLSFFAVAGVPLRNQALLPVSVPEWKASGKKDGFREMYSDGNLHPAKKTEHPDFQDLASFLELP